MKYSIPLLFALANVAAFARLGMAPPERGMHLQEYARLPILEGGRKKPLDTFARVSLQILSVRQEYKDDADKSKPAVPAIQWLLDVWSSPDMFEGPAADYKVFRIDGEQLLNALQLEPRPGSYRYSLKELKPKYEQIFRDFRKARDEKKAKDRTQREQQNFELGQHLELYESILRLRVPLVVPPQDSVEEWRVVARITEPLRRQIMGQLEEEINKGTLKIDQMTWLQFAGLEARIDRMTLSKLHEISPAAAAFTRIADRYQANDAEGFNEALAEFQTKYQTAVTPQERSKVNFEAYFNRLAPFYWSMYSYLFVFLTVLAAWVSGWDVLRRAALSLGTSAFLIHSAALIARMVIQGRPPVTNLYSSAVFIGWGSVGLLLLLELVYKNGVSISLAGVLGGLSLIVAHFLSLSGDTLEMMQAVLDTNFWLATHVTTVTLGYGATFVAGFVGCAFVLGAVATPWLDGRLQKHLTTMTYGVICFATLLSFVGTVLGGIWADQSWGRFWGWDPKENGALLIVIWNAMILHARWAGMIKARGIAVLAILGNIVVAWSWFGTNQLGVGLHAYGFNNGVSMTMIAFDGAMLAIVLIGCLPTGAWMSNWAQPAPDPMRLPSPPSRKPGEYPDVPSWLKTVLKYLFGLAVLAWVVRANWESTPPGSGLRDALAGPIHFTPLLLAGLCLLPAVSITFLRWYWLVRALDLPLALRDALRLGLVGYFFNSLLPGAVGGDVVKAAALVRTQDRRTAAIASLLFDRALGLAGLAVLVVLSGGLFSLLGDPILAAQPNLGRVIRLASIAVGVGTAVWLALGLLPEARAEALAGRLPGFFAEAWRAVWIYRKRPGAVAGALAMSVATHIFNVLAFHLATRVFAADDNLPTVAENYLLVPIGIAVRALFPAPGGVGGAEYGFGKLYELVHRPAATAVLGSLAILLLTWILAAMAFVASQLLPATKRGEPTR